MGNGYMCRVIRRRDLLVWIRERKNFPKARVWGSRNSERLKDIIPLVVVCRSSQKLGQTERGLCMRFCPSWYRQFWKSIWVYLEIEDTST